MILKKIIKKLKEINNKILLFIRYNNKRKVSEKYLFNYIKNENTSNVRYIIDACWDNPNYWLRYSVLHKSLSLNSMNAAAVIGPHNRKSQLKTLKRFKINKIYDYLKKNNNYLKNKELAKKIVNSLTCSNDIIKLSLPYDLPGTILYDYILKRQSWAYVDIKHPLLEDHIHLFLNCISISEEIIDDHKPDLIISSHALNYNFPLVWLGLLKKIKVIVPYGNYGLIRFWQTNDVSMIYKSMDRPYYEDYLKLTDKQKRNLSKYGVKYLDQRTSGKTTNIGAMYAYNKKNEYVDRDIILNEFNWDKNKEIIIIYASNWFDFPHKHGMSYFTDFHDWIKNLINVIKSVKDFNWLLKAHPIDTWYGGITLKDFIDISSYENINFVKDNWNGKCLLNSVNAVVTHHGTVGIEATANKIPVLATDIGWYTDWEFVRVPKNKQDFLNTLKIKWWQDMDINKNSELAKIFAGWFFCRPEWQNSFLLKEDTRKWEIYEHVKPIMNKYKDITVKEVDLLKKWYKSEYPHYHTYKMMMTDEYII